MPLPKIHDRIDTALNRLTRTSELGIVIVMVGLVLVLFANVLFRYVLSKPLFWSEEVSLFGIVFISYVGGAVLVRVKKNVTISVLVDALNKRVSAVIGVITESLTLFVVGFLFWQTILLIPRLTPTVTPTMRITEGLYPIIAGTGYLLMIFFQLNNTIRAILGSDGRQADTKKEENVPE